MTNIACVNNFDKALEALKEMTAYAKDLSSLPGVEADDEDYIRRTDELITELETVENGKEK